MTSIDDFEKRPHERGTLVTAKAEGSEVEILETNHCSDRRERWEISLQNLLETLFFPDEVLTGHHERYIAHKVYGRHLIRTVYEYEAELPVIITVYSPYTENYFEGGGSFADQILE